MWRRQFWHPFWPRPFFGAPFFFPPWGCRVIWGPFGPVRVC